MHFVVPLVLWALATPSLAPGQSPDSAALLKQAKRAEAEYEFALRRFAPWIARATPAGTCDETIGRYCVTYETGHDVLPAEPKVIAVARDTAIALLLRAFEAAPGQSRAAYPLVRLLVRADRAVEAVEVARRFGTARGATPESDMVLGFALHFARETEAARMAFERWLAGLNARQRTSVQSTAWLTRVPEARTDLLWRYADPLYLTAGNELWTDHLARHALSRMLEEREAAPSGTWGSDDEELTVRFGYPVLTTRSHGAGSMGMNEQFSDHWDPTLRTYVPPRLDSALVMTARIDTMWPLDSLTSRSGHAPPTIRAMRVLEHQAVRYGDSLRVSGVLMLDTLVKSPVTTAVFLLDSALNVVASVRRADCGECMFGDSALLDMRVAVPPAARFYSAEVYDPIGRFAGRARYRLDELSRSGLIEMSGLRLEASRPVVEIGSGIGMYVELTSRSEVRRTVRIELETRSIDRPSAIVRAAGWLGKRLGISSRPAPARLAWDVELEPGATTPLPLQLGLPAVSAGRYRLTMRVVDASGVLVATRDFRVTADGSSSRRR